MRIEEFQRFAETHDGLWELCGGIPVKMKPFETAHQWVCAELQSQFGRYFEGRKCIALPGLHVFISQGDKAEVRRPDLLVFCDKNQIQKNLIYSPQLVVEVWSPSNYMKERLEKLSLYQHIGVKEFWQIDYNNQDFAVITFQEENLTSLSGGSFDEEIVSEYFPGLRVSLAGYAGFLERF